MVEKTKFLPLLLVLIVAGCSHHDKQQATSTAPQTQAPADTQPIVISESGDMARDEFIGRVTPEEKSKSGREPSVLVDVRTGDRNKYDRIVFEFSSADTPGYKVQYVEQPVASCGSGEPVGVEGQAIMTVQLLPALAHDERGRETVRDRDQKPQLPNLKHAKLSCDFEADVQWVLGLNQKRPYRVLELHDPTRLVIDIRH